MCFVPCCSYSTPTARVPSNRILVASALVSTRTFFALHRRAQEGARGRHAAAVLGVDLVDADAFLALAVEVRVERQAGLLAGLEIALGQRVHLVGS